MWSTYVAYRLPWNAVASSVPQRPSQFQSRQVTCRHLTIRRLIWGGSTTDWQGHHLLAPSMAQQPGVTVSAIARAELSAAAQSCHNHYLKRPPPNFKRPPPNCSKDTIYLERTNKTFDWTTKNVANEQLSVKYHYNIRAVPEIILRGGWAANTFLSCGWRVFCWQCVRGVGGG